MSKHFIPGCGDLFYMQKYESEGKYALNYVFDLSKQSPDSKISLIFIGSQPKIYVHDVVLANNMISKVGNEIDRVGGDANASSLFWLEHSFLAAPSDGS